MSFTRITVQDISSNVVTDLSVQSLDTIDTIEQTLRGDLNVPKSESIRLYSGNRFLESNENARNSVRDGTLYVFRKKMSEYDNLESNENARRPVRGNTVPIKDRVEQRTLQFAEGIKNKDQRLPLKRESVPVSLLT